ncbi:hypothetical protein EV359DRAFT_60983 [Lentinula novae-zelandiae]|nr:hypothetical protein EV359DRAFT_60983 [Lentinula novae-zelandiae]
MFIDSSTLECGSSYARESYMATTACNTSVNVGSMPLGSTFLSPRKLMYHNDVYVSLEMTPEESSSGDLSPFSIALDKGSPVQYALIKELHYNMESFPVFYKIVNLLPAYGNAKWHLLSWLASASLLDWTAIITMPINSKVIPVLKTVTWKMSINRLWTISLLTGTKQQHCIFLFTFSTITMEAGYVQKEDVLTLRIYKLVPSRTLVNFKAKF